MEFDPIVTLSFTLEIYRSVIFLVLPKSWFLVSHCTWNDDDDNDKWNDKPDFTFTFYWPGDKTICVCVCLDPNWKNVEFKLNLCHHYDDDYGSIYLASQSVIIFFLCFYYEIENFFSYTDNRRQFPPIDWLIDEIEEKIFFFIYHCRQRHQPIYCWLNESSTAELIIYIFVFNVWNFFHHPLILITHTRTHLTIPLLFTIISFGSLTRTRILERIWNKKKKRGKYWFEFWRKKNFFLFAFYSLLFGQFVFFRSLN